MRFHTQTAGVSLTAQQPLNNIVRTAIEALAGVLGGTQSLHTNSYDEALALPTEQAVRIALRTQQIIAHETGVANTIDPLGGSYFVEALTDRMEEQATRTSRKIDELGGMVEAVKRGYPAARDRRRRLHAPAGDRLRAADRRRRQRATSRATRRETPILRIDPALERKQIERLRAAKANRDAAAVEAALADAEGRGRQQPQPDAAADRRRPRPRLRGRDRPGAPAGLGRLPRAAGLHQRLRTAQALTPGAP